MEEVGLNLGQWFSVISMQLIQLRSFKISKTHLSSTKSDFIKFLTHYLLTLSVSVSKSKIKRTLDWDKSKATWENYFLGYLDIFKYKPI